jgi:RNA 2',3'-cyclic 3'-phosphodiesterase
MRIFIGIKLDTAAIEHVEKFLKPFKKISTPIRWVKPSNIHITLKFIGDIPDNEYPQIEQAVLQATKDLNLGGLDLKLTGCGKFGKRDSLNIFWIGVSPNETMTRLYEQIEITLVKLGAPKEDRPFKPHITVGRNNKNYNFKSLFNLVDEHSERRITDMRADRFQIFESRLTPEGPIYIILKEIPLVYT